MVTFVGPLFVRTILNSKPPKVLTRFVAAEIWADNPDGMSAAETVAIPSDNIADDAMPMSVDVFINRAMPPNVES